MKSIDESLDDCLEKLKTVSEVLRGYSEYDGWGYDIKQLKISGSLFRSTFLVK